MKLQSVSHNFSLKLKAFLLLTLFLLFAIQFSTLEAGGWGNTEEAIEYEGAVWDGVYFDMNGLHFTGFIPNYSGAVLEDDTTSLNGEIGIEIGYVIETSLNNEFSPPKHLEKFIKMVQEANPKYVVSAIKSKKFGAKYVVNLEPINQEENKAFWRFLCTKNRLIRMGTDDSNPTRRLKFFESIYIH